MAADLSNLDLLIIQRTDNDDEQAGRVIRFEARPASRSCG